MQAVFRPAEVRFQPHFSKWHKLESSVSVNVDTLIPTPQRDVSSLQKSIRVSKMSNDRVTPTSNLIGACDYTHIEYRRPTNVSYSLPGRSASNSDLYC